MRQQLVVSQLIYLSSFWSLSPSEFDLNICFPIAIIVCLQKMWHHGALFLLTLWDPNNIEIASLCSNYGLFFFFLWENYRLTFHSHCIIYATRKQSNIPIHFPCFEQTNSRKVNWKPNQEAPLYNVLLAHVWELIL